MLKVTLAMLFLILIGTRAFGYQAISQGACDAKDLTSALGPVRNQGNLGWCYANAAADLLQYALGTKDQISATYMALIYNHAAQDNPIGETGSTVETLKETLLPRLYNSGFYINSDRGYCMQARENFVFRNSGKTTLKQRLSKFKELKGTFDLKKTDDKYNEIFNSQLQGLAASGSVFDEVNRGEFLDMLDRSSPQDIFVNFANYICGSDSKRYLDPSVKMSVVEIPYQDDSGKENDLIKKLHDLLSHNQIAEVSFNASFLQDNTADQTHSVAAHASVIVGRRWNSTDHTCEFLLRNSWGANCNGYSKWVTCEPSNPGNLWIRESRIYQATSAITYVQK